MIPILGMVLEVEILLNLVKLNKYDVKVSKDGGIVPGGFIDEHEKNDF